MLLLRIHRKVLAHYFFLIVSREIPTEGKKRDQFLLRHYNLFWRKEPQQQMQQSCLVWLQLQSMLECESQVDTVLRLDRLLKIEAGSATIPTVDAQVSSERVGFTVISALHWMHCILWMSPPPPFLFLLFAITFDTNVNINYTYEYVCKMQLYTHKYN